jgi:glycosyltransferase involved in cell wall biosynthesis
MNFSVRPLVSVVMPSLNQGRFIDAAIDSVLSQDYPQVELIVADGASTDDTLHRLTRRAQADQRLRWFSEPDTGPADAVNKALARVRGTVIGWLNADDLYAPGAINRAVDAFNENSNWLMVYGNGEHVDVDGRVTGRYPTLPPQTPFLKFAEGCFVCQPTVFFRRTMVVLLGNLDESLKTAFDFDYWLRAFSFFPERIGFVDAVQAGSRLHDGGITQRSRRRVMLEGMHLLSAYLGASPQHWVLTYADELRSSGLSAVEHGAEMASFLSEAKPYLDEADFRQLLSAFGLHEGGTPRIL